MGPRYMLSQGGRFRTPPGAPRTPPEFFGPLRGAYEVHSRPAGKWPLAWRKGSGPWPGGRGVAPGRAAGEWPLAGRQGSGPWPGGREVAPGRAAGKWPLAWRQGSWPGGRGVGRAAGEWPLAWRQASWPGGREVGRQGSWTTSGFPPGRIRNSRQLERVQVTIDSSLQPDWSSEGVCRPELETDRRGAANGTLLYVVPGGSFPDASGSFPDPP